MSADTLTEEKNRLDLVDVKKLIERANSLHLADVMSRAKKQCVSGTNFTTLEKEYRRFLVLAFQLLLAKCEHIKCRPPQLIDTVWHNHILLTQQYEADCKRMAETFLHHTPETKELNKEETFLHHTPETKEVSKEEAYKDYCLLMEHYKKVFGENPSWSVWDFPVGCITCG